MSPVYIGSSAITAAYVGDTALSKIYLGDTQVWPSPLVYVNAAIAASTSVALPAHQVGDTILIFSLSGWGSTTVPSIPSAGGTVPTFTSIRDGNNGVGACRLAYATASATNHTSGTWTSASAVMVVVLRNAAAAPIGGNAIGGTAGSPTAPAVTLSQTDGSSMLLHFYGAWGSPTWSTAPAGYTRRAANNAAGLCVNTKNSSTSDGSVAQSLSGGYGWYMATSVEILD